MIEIEKPKIECVELSERGDYGRFEVEPLERGYGMTLGNSLRRILLSSHHNFPKLSTYFSRILLCIAS